MHSVALYGFPCDFSQWFISNANDFQLVYSKANDSQLQMQLQPGLVPKKAAV
jgi:hypothetical protein